MQSSSNNSTHSTKKTLGASGENLVAEYVRKHGFLVMHQNYTKRCGEIDIIARKQDVLAFIEVKLRSNEYFPVSQVITYSKQKKIIKTAESFIFEHKLYNLLYRFDVALVTYKDENKPDLGYYFFSFFNYFTKYILSYIIIKNGFIFVGKYHNI